jgi:hypothetical protein
MLIEAIPEGKMCPLSTAVEAVEQTLSKLYEGNSRLSILVTTPKLESSATSRTISNSSSSSGNKMESTVRGPKPPPLAPLSLDLKAKIDRVQPNSTQTQAQITRTASGSNLKNLMNALNSDISVNALDLKLTTPNTSTSSVKDSTPQVISKPLSAITPPTSSTPTTVTPSSSSFLANSSSAPATYNSLAQKPGNSIASNTPTIRKEPNFAANAKRSFFVSGNTGLLPVKKTVITPSSSSSSGVNLRPTVPQPSTQADALKKNGVESLN